MLRRLTGDPERPYVVVLGGSKVSDKLAVIESLLPKVDRLLVGGGMCFTFLAAQGHEVGDSLLEADQVDNCRRLPRRGRRQDRAAHRHRRRRRRSPTTRPRRSSRPTRSRPAARGSTSAPTRCGVRGRARRRADGVLERADGRVRGGAVRRGHPGRRRGGGGRRRACRSSAAATRPRRCARWAWTSTRSGTSPPAAARRWSTSRARTCRVSPFWKRSEVAQRHDRTPADPAVGGRRPLIAGNWKMNYNHLEAIALVQKLIFSLDEEQTHRVEVVVLPPFVDIRSVQTLVDGDAAADRLRRAGSVAARLRRVHRRRRRPDAGQARLQLRRRRALRAARVPRTRTTRS